MTLIALSTNVTSVKSDASGLQDFTILLLIVNLVEIVLQFMLVMKENCTVSELREHDPEKHKPASEEQKRN